MPILMPNIITAGQTVFWFFWVNGLFLMTIILPHQASYIFPYKHNFKILEKFKNIMSPKKNIADIKDEPGLVTNFENDKKVRPNDNREVLNKNISIVEEKENEK